jgi:hypothetical protein
VYRTVLASLLLTGLSVPGCLTSDGLGKVSGKVTFRGAPVTEGSIEFSKADYAADVPLGPDGAFRFETPEGGIPVGEYAVAIRPAMIPDPRDDPARTPPGWIEKDDPNIPQKYRNSRTSGLSATVAGGQNTFDFDLQ